MPFRKDDLEGLFFDTDKTKGQYMFSSWEVQPGKGSDSENRRMVSLHESHHAALNDQTAFGGLMHCIHYLGINGHQQEQHTKTLIALVNSCRTIHECYATYISLLFVANTLDKYLPQRERLLEGYDTYVDYYQAMAQICLPFQGAFLQFHACSSVARICMQSRSIETFLDVGPDQFTFGDIRAKDQPDERFRILQSEINGAFWEKAWEHVKKQFLNHPAIGLIEQHENQPENTKMFHQAMDKRYDALSSRILEIFHNELNALLAQQGSDSLPYDGHQEFVRSSMQACLELIPAENARYPLHSALDVKESELDVLRDYEHERYVIHEDKLPARIFPLMNSESGTFLDPICDTYEQHHYFLVSRFVSRLSEQYSFRGQSLIEESYTDDILYFFRRRRKVDGSWLVEFFLIMEPTELIQFVRLKDPKIPIYSNLTMSGLASGHHLREWYGALEKHTFVTTLFDLSPFGNFDTWKDEAGYKVRFNSVQIKLSENEHSCFLCQLEVDDNPLLITPCSLTVSQTLRFYLRQFDDERFIDDAQFFVEDQQKLFHVMAHLIREEPFFDFKAKKSNLPL